MHGAGNQERCSIPVTNPRGMAACLGLALCLWMPCLAYADGNLLAFPELGFEWNSGDDPDDAVFSPLLDVFGSAHRGRWNALVEAIATDHDFHIERLHLGYDFSPASTLRLGRIHNPLSYWVMQYHHANYLRPSISSPESARFDDDGGIFPSHLAGLLFSTEQVLGERSIDYTLALGTGPELEGDHDSSGGGAKLHAIDLFRPGEGRHRFNATARVALHLDNFGEDQVGAFVSRVRVPVAGTVYDAVNLSVGGAFLHWKRSSLALTGSLFLVRDVLEGAGETRPRHFATGYLHADLPVQGYWTLFGRLERSFGEGGDPYVGLLAQFIARRDVAGVRWDFSAGQAVKLEFSNNHGLTGDFRQILLNWSAGFP